MCNSWAAIRKLPQRAAASKNDKVRNGGRGIFTFLDSGFEKQKSDKPCCVMLSWIQLYMQVFSFAAPKLVQ